MLSVKQQLSKTNPEQTNDNVTINTSSEIIPNKHLMDPVTLGFYCIEYNYEDLFLLLLGVITLEEKNNLKKLHEHILSFEKEQRSIQFDLKCLRKFQTLLELFSQNNHSILNTQKIPP